MDRIPAEAIKANLETSVEMMYTLVRKIGETEEIPKEWKEGYLVKLYPRKEICEIASTIVAPTPFGARKTAKPNYP